MSAAPTVSVLACAPTLMVVVEREPEGRVVEIHLHPGGQGFWAARMAARLGAATHLVGPFAGEPGTSLRALVEAEGLEVHEVPALSPNGVWVSDGPEGEAPSIAEVPVPRLSRHEADGLVSAMLAHGLRSRVSVLTGSPPGVLDGERYGRLAHDLHAVGGTVLADLSGDQLEHAVEGGVDVLKVAHDELAALGLAEGDDEAALLEGARELQRRGTGTVVVSRAHEPLLALTPEGEMRVDVPEFEPANHRGAGDSMTGALAARLAGGAGIEEALRWATAAGALNVTRHGLGSGDVRAISELAERVRVSRG